MVEARKIPPTSRPVIMGTKFMVSTGHYLASAAAIRILEAGGNAFDAGVAGGLCLNVVQADLSNLGGVAPICLYSAQTGRVETISGLGWWPAATDYRFFNEHQSGRIFSGVNACVTPAAFDAWLTALEHYGRMSFAEVAAPAIELAEGGFAMHSLMRDTFTEPSALESMRSWPANREIFLDSDGEVPPVGTLVYQKDLARTLRMLVEASEGASSREAGIQAARGRFYGGDIADRMVEFTQREGGWLTHDDLASFRVAIEPPVSVDYRGYQVYACGAWCQGPVVPHALNILKGYDLSALGPRSAKTYHLILEALNAAFADRDRYIADPRFTPVPLDGMLSDEYARRWRERIDPERALGRMPEPGDPWPLTADPSAQAETKWCYPKPVAGPDSPDTTYLCVVDGEGNAFSCTCSDGCTASPIVPGLGFCVSGRGKQSWVDQNHPSAVAPGRRPRLTPSPGIVMKDGKLVMPYGTPGNDMQPQAMLQFLVNVIDFEMGVQAAVEEPRCATFSFPRSSDPHPYYPGLVHVEARAGTSAINGLRELGHKVDLWPEYTGTAGSVAAVYVDQENHVLHGAADPRRMAYAMGR